MKKILFTTLLFLSILKIFAQEEVKTEIFAPKNEFGAHYGLTTGVGLSFRRWEKTNTLGFQLTAMPIKTDENSIMSLGFTGLLSFYQTSNLRVYAYWGTHFMHSKTTDPYSYPQEIIENKFNMGAGPGFSFGEKVGFNVMFGFGIYDMMNEGNILPTGEIGLYYRY